MEDKGVWQYARGKIGELAADEVKFWEERRTFWRDRGLAQQQREADLASDVGELFQQAEAQQKPADVQVVKSIAEGTTKLDADATELHREMVEPGATPAPVDAAADREFLETTKKPTAEMSPQEIEHELEITDRMPGQSVSDGEYVEEISLSNDHEWKAKASGAFCRFSNEVCFVHKRRGRPTLAPEGWRIQFVNSTNVPDVVPPNVVLEFPEGERVWRKPGEEGGIAIESRLGPARGRKEFEKAYFSRGEMGTPEFRESKQERAHSQGQGTGFESPYAIPYAPAEVNQEFQNTGIEMYLRWLEKNKAPGVEYRLVTDTVVHPDTRRLKFSRYRIDAEFGGTTRDLFSMRINVENKIESPKVWLDEAEMTRSPDAVALLQSMNCRMIFTKDS